MECHHIVHESAGGKSEPDNCIPVCFDCHADMTSKDFKHPKGTKYSEKELRGHRDRWYAQVKSGARHEIDAARQARDRRVFEAFVATIKYDPTIVYFRAHSFESAFPNAVLEPLHEYEFYKDDPKHQFADPDLEALRGSFVASLDAFTWLLATNTWPLNHMPGYNQIPTEWRETNFGRLMDVLEKLKVAYDHFESTYKALVVECQIRLGA